MKCKNIYHHICENLDADINSPKCKAIKKHLDECPDCSAYLDSLKKTIVLYRRETGPTVALSVHNRLWKNIDSVWMNDPSKTKKGRVAPRSIR